MKLFTKKSIVLALAMAAILPNAFAERDVLLETNPATAIVGTNDFLIEAVRPQTAEQIEAFATQWSKARAAIALAQLHKTEGQLTEVDEAWLEVVKNDKRYNNRHSYASLFKDHTLGRVHFYERSHNWNGENEFDNEYRYFTYPGAKNEGADKYVNSYGFNVLRTMADKMNASMHELSLSELQGEEFRLEVVNRLTGILEETQSTVQNDELRYYANQVVWYATKQTMKVRGKVESIQ